MDPTARLRKIFSTPTPTDTHDPLEAADHHINAIETSHAALTAATTTIDTITTYLNLPATTLLLVATPREGTTTLGPQSTSWITVRDAAHTDTLNTHLHGTRLTGWLATNTARQHTDYTQAATHLTERTTP